MAKILENKKGFKVIQMSYAEISILTGNPCPICDMCANPKVAQGYYIAVLNQWFCKKCYNEWYERAEFYPEDARIENEHFEFYKNLCIESGILDEVDI